MELTHILRNFLNADGKVYLLAETPPRKEWRKRLTFGICL